MEKNKTDERIKPCPFCGGQAYIENTFGNLHILCHHRKSCIAKPNTWLNSSNIDIYKQIKLWNKRKGNDDNE